MDNAAHIDPTATAAHLAALGCTAEQIDRHVKRLATIAAERAKGKKAPKPQGRERTISFNLTEEQILDCLHQLRERQWRWAIARPAGDTGEWVGHCIATVVGRPLGGRSAESSVIVGDCLHQLRTLGLIERRATKRVGERGASYVVEVVRSHRVRLQAAEKRERAASAGGNGSANGKLPNGRERQSAPRSDG